MSPRSKNYSGTVGKVEEVGSEGWKERQDDANL
jgi:hypothetical protein